MSPAIFYALVVEAALVGLLLAVVTLAYYRMAKKYFSLKQAEKRLNEEAIVKTNQAIAEANKQAQEIISTTQNTMNSLTNSMQGKVDELSNQEIEEYKKVLETLSSNTNNILQNISKDVKESMLSQVNIFGEKLIKETQAERAEVLSHIEEEFEKAKNEAEEYKKGLFVKAEQNIYEIVNNISKKVIGKSLNVEEHEDLVIQALEEAKRQHVL